MMLTSSCCRAAGFVAGHPTPAEHAGLLPAIRLVWLLDADADFSTLVAGSEPDRGDDHVDTHPQARCR